MRKRRILLTEFNVQVYSDGIEWDGAGEFLMWLMHRKENLLPYIKKISKFGTRPRRSKRRAR